MNFNINRNSSEQIQQFNIGDIFSEQAMGNYKALNKNVDNTKLPRIDPEPNYQIKTRAPINIHNSWQDNIRMRIRQQLLSDQAMPIARRKCYDPAMKFAQCRLSEGFFWYVFNCQEDFHELGQCLEHQFNVEMDKRRRDMSRNVQPWWRRNYDENGQIGQQAATPEYDPSLWQSIKYTIFGGSQPKANLDIQLLNCKND